MNENRAVPSRVVREIIRLSKEFPVLSDCLVYQSDTGCLEYRGPKRGHVEGNPSLRLAKEKRYLLLRRTVWMMHGHRIPKGQFVVMACQNHRCHRFEHMELKKTIVHYRDPKRISASHLTPEEAKVLRYYCRRVTTQTLMEVFGVSDHFIYHERKRKTPPARYRPSPAWVRRIYTVVRKGQRNSRILDAEKLKRARKDIRSAPLMRKEKKVLLRSIEGEGMASIARDLGMTSNYGYMMRNRALARLCITIGERDWIREMFKRRSSWRAWMKRNKGKPEGYRIGARYK